MNKKNIINITCKNCKSTNEIYEYSTSCIKCIVCNNIINKKTGGKTKPI